MLRTARIAVLTGLLGITVTLATRTVPPAESDVTAMDPAPAPPIPFDVLLRSDVARTNMKQIAIALLIYAANNRERFPSDLTLLYPDYLPDPAVFWHPGDSDPQPTTIDNNQPNHPNSTRISYEYSLIANGCETEPFIWDNTSANNAGLFVNRLSQTLAHSTDPPFITPTPSRLAIAQHNLLVLANGMFEYLSWYGDWFPDEPMRLWNDGLICSPGVFWNPGDDDPEPTDITNAVPDAANSALVSFEFPAIGHRWDELSPDDVLIQDNSPANNGGHGINVVRVSGRLDFISTCPDPFADADRDGDVDQRDFGELQRCLSPAGPVLPGCECFDRPERLLHPVGDGDVDPIDAQKFLTCSSGPGITADPACDD